ncbi:MAG: carboxypeptidase-like regulatory domain-containing protein [Filimonas sp.]|nr:carboxypeptidase-like regulatory domain-containing protein [Filimonas sp.]
MKGINHQLQKLGVLAIGFIFLFAIKAGAQSILNRTVSFDVRQEKLENVLGVISNKANFYFSYSSNIIKKDSLVSLKVYNKTVKEVLDLLLKNRYSYKENTNYLIIKKETSRMTIIANQAILADKSYIISGFIIDEESGEKIKDASIYEKQQLVSTLTDDNGYFKIKLKSKYRSAEISVSKVMYEDTTVNVKPQYNQELTIAISPIEIEGIQTIISPEDYTLPDSVIIKVKTDTTVSEYTFVKKDSVKVEKTLLGRFFLSSSQQVQSLNLKKFFTERPVQVSLTPGLSSHGSMSGSVVNHFSLNVIGGYTAGTKGAEIGGVFNIDAKDVTGVQVAGIFNIVGGGVDGVQVAGVHNMALDNVIGVQVAGISNVNKHDMNGVQVGGIYNHVGDEMNGIQVGGISNYAKGKVNGMQVAGIANIANTTFRGVQVGGIFNYAKQLKGVQIGLINIADTSDGYSVGLINIIKKGYHKLAITTNEVMDANVAFKTGNSKLYSILIAGFNTNDKEKVYSFGYGFGREIKVAKWLTINPEISTQYLYLGSWDYNNSWNKFGLNINLKINKWLAIYGGPTFNALFTDQPAAIDGYKFAIPGNNYHKFDLGNDKLKSWIGWNAGISFF